MAIILKILLFFLISYAFTWAGNLVNYLQPGANWWTMNPLGPFLAAPLAIWMTEGRTGVKHWWARIWRFKAPAWIYFAAIFGTFAISALSTGAAMLLSGDRPTPEQIAAFPAALIEFPLIMFLFGPFTEETTFRGHAQFQLEKVWSPLAVALVIGFGVVIWHLPLFIAKEIPPVLAICLMAVSIVYAWMFRAGGSVWPLILLHGVVNGFNGPYFGNMLSEQSRNIELIIFTVFWVLWAALIVRRNGPSLGRSAFEREGVTA